MTAFKRALLGTTTVMFALSSMPAMAQNTGVVEEIVVTARKRTETLQEIPISVSAFSADKISELGVNNLESLSSYTSGFVFQNTAAGGAGGRQNPSIRFRGQGVQAENGAARAGAVFWNGTYISDGAGILPLMDLARVEVIKGPQTAFFGRNTFAGAVNFIPAEPGDEFAGKGSASFSPSNESSYNVTAAAGGPITDTFGLRLAAMIDRVGADWNYDNGDPAGQENTKSISANMVLKPSDSLKLKANGFYVDSDDTRALQGQSSDSPPGTCNQTFSGNLRRVGTGAAGAAFTTNLATANRAIFCGALPDWTKQNTNLSPVGKLTSTTPLFPLSTSLAVIQTKPVEMQKYNTVSAPDGLGVNYSLWRVNLSGEYTLSNDATIFGIASRGIASNWSFTDNLFGTPATGLGPNPWLVGFVQWTRDKSAEVRYTSDSESNLRYMIGASYYAQDTRSSDYPAFAGATGYKNNIAFETGKNRGIFGSVDYDFTDQLTLSLEGRWHKDTQTILYQGISQPRLARNFPVGTAGPFDIAPNQNLPQEYKAFMPRAILAYKPNADMNLYTSFSKSKLQGFSTNAAAYSVLVPAAGLTPDAIGFFTPIQTLSAYEVGFKQQVSDKLSYSVAGYYMDWKNQVFFELSPSFVAVYLPGDSRTYGVDFDAQFSPTDWLQLSTAATYTDVKFTKFGATGSLSGAVLFPALAANPGFSIDAKGNRPRYIPKWSGNLAATLQIGQLMGYEPGAYLRVDGVYQGNFFADNTNFLKVAGYWKLNASAHVNINEDFAMELYGKNLTNDLSWTTTGGDTGGVGTLARKSFGSLPRKREIGVKALYKF